MTFCLFLVLIFLLLALCWKITWWFFRMVFGLFVVLLLLLMLSIPAHAHEYTPEDIVLIGKVVHHEAGNQSDLGKRLVADTIFNRVESDKFPNTVKEVINQEGQYCNPKDYPPDELYRLIANELYFRTNDQVLWFRKHRYHSYGKPLLIEGDHYFSGGM